MSAAWFCPRCLHIKWKCICKYWPIGNEESK